MMDKNKLIDKLLSKYPELNKEPLFDELISMDESEMPPEGEMGEMEMEPGEGMPAEEDGAGEEEAFGKPLYSDEEESGDNGDDGIESEMLEEAANSDKMLNERVRDKLKMKKYGSKV